MAKASKALMIPDELVMNKIYIIRGKSDAGQGFGKIIWGYNR